MCAWATQGIYIKILCLLHKSEPYGTILLKQNDKQTENFALNFATKITKLLPIEKDVLYEALVQLIEEGCLSIDGDRLYQKRMIRDNELSIIRAKSGKAGGLKTQFAKAKSKASAKAKSKANTENEYIYNNNIYNNNNNKDLIEDKSTERRRFKKPTIEEIESYCQERNNGIDAKSFFDHYEARGWIPKGYTTQMKDWKAAVRTWESHKKSFNNTPENGINRTNNQRRGEKTDQYWHS